MLTDIGDNAPRFHVQQELSDLWPGSVAAVIEIWSNLVIDAVDVVSLELTGSLFHHIWASCRDLTELLLQGHTHFQDDVQRIKRSNGCSISLGKKEAVTTPWWEDYRGASTQIDFSRKPSTADRFNYPGLPKRDMSFHVKRLWIMVFELRNKFYKHNIFASFANLWI